MIAALWTFLLMPLWGMSVWAWIAVATPLWGIPALWLLYPIAIQYERAQMGQGWWWWFCLVFVIPALVIDVIVNWTSLAVVFGLPRYGEWTFSTHLKRIYMLPLECWRRSTGRAITLILNVISPSGKHIEIPST
jgi:hypothetical protein